MGMNAPWQVWWVLITGIIVGQKVTLVFEVREVPRLVVGSEFDKVWAEIKGWQATFPGGSRGAAAQDVASWRRLRSPT